MVCFGGRKRLVNFVRVGGKGAEGGARTRPLGIQVFREWAQWIAKEQREETSDKERQRVFASEQSKPKRRKILNVWQATKPRAPISSVKSSAVQHLLLLIPKSKESYLDSFLARAASIPSSA